MLSSDGHKVGQQVTGPDFMILSPPPPTVVVKQTEWSLSEPIVLNRTDTLIHITFLTQPKGKPTEVLQTETKKTNSVDVPEGDRTVLSSIQPSVSDCFGHLIIIHRAALYELAQ